MIPRSKEGVFNENDLIMYLGIGLKHFRLMVLLVCFALLLGLAYYNYVRPVYYASSLVNCQTLIRAVDTEAAFKDSSERVIIAQLTSPRVKERTARRLGFKVSARAVDKEYLRKLVVRFDAQRNIVIEVWAYSYPLARDWAETMVQEYLLDREERRLAQTETTVQAFSGEMAEMKERMDNLFNSKYDLRDTNELTKIAIELNQLRDIPREMLATKRKLGMMERTREILEGQDLDTLAKLSLLSSLERELEARMDLDVGDVLPRKDGPPLVVVPPMVESSLGKHHAWEDLDKEKRRVEQQYNELGLTFKPGHREMIKLRKKMEGLDRSLNLELEIATNRFELTYVNLTSKKRELDNRLPEYNEVLRRYDKAAQDYQHLDDGQLAWRKMHAELEKRLQVLDFGEDKERANLKYMGYLEPLRTDPVSPNGSKLAIYSFLLGLALAIAVPFLIEYLDSRVSDIERVEEILRMRGLGVVPKIEDTDREGLVLLGDRRPDYHLQENFRVIRTNLIINSEAANLPQIILVTSAMPQEGKTVVSSNLAMSFALKGERTLLIDADLRRGRLHRLFGTNNKPGLSDILAEKKTIEEACRPTEHEYLTLMACGKHLNSASELLDSGSFIKLMEELRHRYQRIIVDSPPVLGLAETSIIQRTADGILFVIWSEFTPIRNVKSAIQSLQSNGAKFAGFVLNRLDLQALGNRYRYFYYAPDYYTNYKALEAPPAVAKS